MHTSKPLFSSERYTSYDEDVKKFKTLDEAKEYISNQYYKPCKKEKMYVDDKNGQPVQSGYIYCYTVPKAYYNYNEPAYHAQDWVSIEYVTEKRKIVI